MIIIFGSIILIVLVIFIILAINKKIDYKIPILFMFFVLVSAPFVHLDKNIVQLEKFTNSSLDIYYTNQKKTTNTQNKISYEPTRSGIWAEDAMNEYSCQGAEGARADISGWCIFRNENDAKNQCNSDSRCTGYVSNSPDGFQLTKKDPIPNTVANGTFYKKTIDYECKECAGICDDEEKPNNKNELYIPLLDPLKLSTSTKNLRSIMIEYLVVKKEYFDCSINGKKFDNENELNLIQVNIEGKIKHHVLKNKFEIEKLYNSTKDNTYIILITSGKIKLKNPTYYLDINSNSDESTSITIVFKSNDEYNQILKKENNYGFSDIHGYKLFDNREFKTIDFEGKIYDTPVVLESEKKHIYKNSLISSNDTKTKQYLVFSNENNQSFVYLSGNTNELELYDYKKTDANEIIDITLLNTNNPQRWDIEFVQSNFGGQNSYIKTSSYPTFYLEVVDNEIKMNMYRGGSNQYWKLIMTNKGKNLFTIQHSKTGMFLSYQNNDGYLYKNNGSVYLSESGMEWNIESNTIIDKTLSISDNDWIEITSPDDFVNKGNPIFDLRGRINGKMINLSSQGRTTWDQKYSQIWNGDYIYYGTITNYNKNKFKCINLYPNGGNYTTPIRINNNGDTECMSTDSWNCLWSWGGDLNHVKKSCENYLKQYENSPKLNPVACGEVHKSRHGWKGYEVYEHWCSTGKREYSDYLNIKLDNNGNGIVKDPYLGITINVKNIGADILYGKISSGNLNGIDLRNFTAILEMVHEKYEYRSIRASYPVKIRYLLIGDNKIYSLGSSNLDNLDSYATKKEGEIVIYSNLLESKGIQVDKKLATPKLK